VVAEQPYPGTTPLLQLYAGDGNVDAVALDGENWPTVRPDLGWQSFDQIFRPGIERLTELTDRCSSASVASAEQGGHRAA
jgi:hypothetical protein